MDTRGAINLTSSGAIHVPDRDAPITEKHRRVDELLRGYDPYLELMFIPPGSRGVLDTKPWAVVHRLPGAEPYYVGFFDDADERLLAAVIRADNLKKSVLSEMDALNLAQDALKRKEEQEAMEEAHAFAASVLRSRKYNYKHNGVNFGEFRGR